jgi:photosystem II stability/assembly factor-like uncharacterized protein
MKKIFWIFPLMLLVLSGCSLPGMEGSGQQGGSVLKSVDGGQTFESKVKIDDTSNIASVEVLSMVINPQNSQNIFLGTRDHGIFVTEDGGEHWKKLNYLAKKVYGLTMDAQNPKRIFATGEWQNQGRIYRSEDAGVTWKEIYTEPSGGTVMLSLAESSVNPSTLYAGTSNGVVVKTTDGGETWSNVALETGLNQGMISAIVFDVSQSETVYFVARNRGLFMTRDGGRTVTDLREATRETVGGATVLALTPDPVRSGTVYAGTDKGLFRGTDFGQTWTEVSIIESSKQFPIRSVAVNPRNSGEIMYNAAVTLYKSTDGGAHWSTHRLPGSRVAGVMTYDPADPSVVYIGLRNP